MFQEFKELTIYKMLVLVLLLSIVLIAGEINYKTDLMFQTKVKEGLQVVEPDRFIEKIRYFIYFK